ncbi:MAG: hypothetical protein AMXMBFR64_13260 [Myxococcales bacterium]
MTPEMLAQLSALRMEAERAPRAARVTERVPPPAAHPRPAAAPHPAPAPHEDSLEPDASTRMLDHASIQDLLPQRAPAPVADDGSTRMLDLATPAPRPAGPQAAGGAHVAHQVQGQQAQGAPAAQAAPAPAASHAQRAPRPQDQARATKTPPVAPDQAPDESAITGLPRLPVSPEDAVAAPAAAKPLQQLGYAFRHLKAMGVIRLAEHTLDRRAAFLEEEHGRTFEELGFALWRAGVRVRGLEDAYATLDALRGRREELEAAVREQEGAVAQEKEVIKSELDEAAQAVAESDRSLATLVANLRAVDTELAAARRDQSLHKRGAEAAKKEIAALKGAKGGADAGRIAALEADVARHVDSAAPLDDLVATLQKRRSELATAENTVREKVAPLRQQESRLLARIASKDREVVARTHATREQLTGVAKEMAGPARRIGEAADANRGAFPAYAQAFFKLDAIEMVRAWDSTLRERFREARTHLDDAQAKKGWIVFSAVAGVVVVLLVVLSVLL